MRARPCLVAAVLTLLGLLPACKSSARSRPPPPPLPERPAGPHPRLLLDAPTLAALKRRAEAKAPAWQRLWSRCRDMKGARVEWPDGNRYPEAPHLGEGYQGDEYYKALLSLSLCYQVTRDKAYAQKGAEILERMSEPSGPHAVDPGRDSGFGIRFYGVGMALGFDWLYDALPPSTRARVVAALDRWIGWYDERGFLRDHPQGNYFAGYYAAKALAALATEGDNPKAPAEWRAWYEKLHAGLVQPYYAEHMAGGGWPEGWNYGPIGTMNMIWPVLAARTAKQIDLVRGPAPYAFPVEQARHLLHAAWPTRRSLDDRGTLFGSENPSEAKPALFTFMSHVLERLQDPLAPAFHRYAREVRAGVTAPRSQPDPWQEMLFWDEAAPEADYTGEARTFVARGMQTVTMRSSWAPDAVWAHFTSGTYVGSADSGEMYFDQGALTIVRGDRPLLVNAAAALQRHTPGTQDGEGVGDRIYEDLFGNNDTDRTKGNRTLFNVFYAAAPHYGQIAAGPDEAHTRLERVEDGGAYVLARGTRLEEMYRPMGKRQPRAVASWTRQVIYLRPGRFVVEDRTEVPAGVNDTWLAFHLGGRPVPDPADGGRRLLVGAGGAFAGAITPLGPAGRTTKVVDVFDRKKVFRLEVHAPPGTTRWLTVVEAATPAALGRASALTIEGGAGALIEGPGESSEVAATADGETVTYAVPAHATSHVVVGLKRGATYAVTSQGEGGRVALRIVPGAGRAASGEGVLCFTTASTGALGDCPRR